MMVRGRGTEAWLQGRREQKLMGIALLRAMGR